MHRFFPLLIVLFFLSNTADAQKIGNVWYFGKYCGVTFDTPDGKPRALTDNRLEMWEGCATISNPLGKVDVYTDGINVINKVHAYMSVAGAVRTQQLNGGSSSSQSAIIVPKPGDSLLYYIFTTDAFENQQAGRSTGLNYSVVDMRYNGGEGNIWPVSQNLLPTTLEKVTIAMHRNGVDYWVLAHTYNTDEFYSFLVSASGISAPVISRVSPVIGDNIPRGDQGYMKVSRNGKYIACAYTQISNAYLYDFDNMTGLVSNGRMLFPSNSDIDFYGVEFSPDGSKLYLSFFGIKRGIYQLDLSSGDITTIRNSVVSVLNEGGFPPGALQLGPDGRIYASKDISPYLHVINFPDKPYPLCDFKQNAVFLDIDNTGRKCHLGLPNTLNSVFFIDVKARASNPACEGDTVFINADVNASTSGYKVKWTGPNGFASSSEDTMIVNASKNATGWYYVFADLNGLVAIDSVYVLIADSPFTTIQTSGPTKFCFGDSVVLKAEPFNTSLFYTWSTGESQRDITVKTSGRYYLNVRNAGNCEYNDSIDIAVIPLPAVSIKPSGNTTFCQGDSVVLEVVPFDPDVDYYWSTGERTRFIKVTSTGNYSVIAVNSDGCKDSTNVDVVVNILPQAIINEGPNVMFCIGDSLMLSASPLGMRYLWSTGDTTPNITIAKPGNYFVVIENEFGCSDTAYTRATNYLENILEIRGNTSFCKSDSSVLWGYGNFRDYVWSTGDSTQTITVRTEGIVTLTAIDFNGCKAYDTVYVDVFELNVDISELQNIQFGKVLIDEDSTITARIYNNDKSAFTIGDISIGNGKIFVVSNSLPLTVNPGDYSALNIKFSPSDIIDYKEVINIQIINPCNMLLTGNVSGTGAVEMLVWLPDTTGNIGETDYCIPVTAYLKTKRTLTANLDWKISIRHRADAFLPPEDTDNMFDSDDRITSYQGISNVNSNSGILVNHCGTILFGEFQTVPLIIDTIRIINPNVLVLSQDGSLTTNDVCQRNISRIRHLKLSEVNVLTMPVREELALSAVVPYDSKLTCKLYGIDGTLMKNLETGRNFKAGIYTLNYNLSELSDNAYIIVISINDSIHVNKIIKISH